MRDRAQKTYLSSSRKEVESDKALDGAKDALRISEDQLEEKRRRLALAETDFEKAQRLVLAASSEKEDAEKAVDANEYSANQISSARRKARISKERAEHKHKTAILILGVRDERASLNEQVSVLEQQISRLLQQEGSYLMDL